MTIKKEASNGSLLLAASKLFKCAAGSALWVGAFGKVVEETFNVPIFNNIVGLGIIGFAWAFNTGVFYLRNEIASFVRNTK